GAGRADGERGHPDGGAIDRPVRAVRRGRDLRLRHRCPGLARGRGRPSTRGVGPDRSGRAARPGPLLRGGPREAARIPALAHADRLGRGVAPALGGLRRAGRQDEGGGCRSGVFRPTVTTTSTGIALSVLVVTFTSKSFSR